ncbi:MAG: alpha/beta hydrolase [Planctomycetaceae bacterium]|jgi:alpha-beta hydrolase superfamily lysophospholipase|nr:alpha/beta hydrolase [Planctomycetaceae bacterium]
MKNRENKKKKGSWMFYFLLGVLLFLIYLVGCRADFLAEQFAFHPPKFPRGDWGSWDKTDNVSKEVSFRNTKNQLLVGRYFECQKVQKLISDSLADSNHPNNATQGSILYCHGNAENISHLVDFALQLSGDLRCNVLIFDYAGYGKSEGNPTAKGILDDGRAARDWLAAHDGISREQVIVYGQSLGGSVAVDIAAGDGAMGLIVESSFTSLGDMGRKIFPFLPANYLLRERLASVEKIGNVTCPVFISHGKPDNVVPFSQGQRLFDNAKEPKTFYITPSGYDYHSAPHCETHRKKLKEFIKSLQKK